MGRPKTADYRAPPPNLFFRQQRDLPIFTHHTVIDMLFDPSIQLGLAMRAAPLFGAEFAYPMASSTGDIKWLPGILAETPELSQWVHQQIKRIWQFDLQKILLAQTWGWSAGEVTYRLIDDKLHVDRILHRNSIDTRATARGGEQIGVRFLQIRGKGAVDLEFPKCLWHSFNPEAEDPYGQSILRGAQSPWSDKALNGGALDVRRLFAHRDAYGGADIGYPSGMINIEGKGQVPARDIAREMIEQMKAGASFTRPSDVDQNGNEQWPVNRATVPSNPVHIFQYPKDLDVEMMRGLRIPDEVVITQLTGAWNGKQVPLQAFFAAADQWLNQVTLAITTQVLEPLVLLNEGRAMGFEVQTRPLGDQIADQMQSGQEGGEVSQQPQPARQNGEQRTEETRFSLSDPVLSDLLVGRGVIDAASLVQAGRSFLNGRTSHSTES